MAVEYDAPECVRYLLTNGVRIDWQNPDDGHKTALHVACVHRRSDILMFLLENGANSSLCCDDGFSPYHVAIQHHRMEQIAILAQHHADFNLYDRRHRTPLMFAATAGFSFDTMKQLMNHGADFAFPTSVSRDQVCIPPCMKGGCCCVFLER